MNKKMSLLTGLLIGSNLCSQQIFADALLNIIKNQTSDNINYEIGFKDGVDCWQTNGTINAKSQITIGRIPPCSNVVGLRPFSPVLRGNQLLIKIGRTFGRRDMTLNTLNITYPVNQLTRVIEIQNSKNPLQAYAYDLTVSP